MAASHFNAAGIPDGFAPKGGFLGLYAGIVVLMWISLSAAVRRERTLEKVGAFLFRFGAGTNVLLLDIFAQRFIFSSPSSGSRRSWRPSDRPPRRPANS
ncbi:MAG: hypothetical protein KGJ84_14535 [Elusimicrobia bacterium]|nr:hypothetical protein [Elusimicrobiota bacterium]